ncbi:MAG: Periplasmic pH-dependent serine endoprotease DegQ [Alphaproteobacteria bacterium MarineAlpha5_Bin12]|nr:serine protease [Pelagibacteraceae bacterium]PPR40723.1 MAG: Periplasmic pH-dependent serine endoprotease DegQ [Alphaproteobacteria bacterium MarineAlpha5_Bin12]|tara:strand:- start:1142 stop:2563 length:1422 start_codon:yes stop_codon:yes gene_type:complete
MKIVFYIFVYVFFIFNNNYIFAKPVPETFADIINPLLSSVVSITSTTIVEDNNQQIPQFPEGSPFEDFFQEYFDQNDNGAKKRPIVGLGSGFIIDDSGIVVTNNHVIEGADEINIIMDNGDEFEATILGKDPKADLAVIKFDPKGKKLNSVEWGDSDLARIGDWAIAIGNPLGVGNTVTAGIVSAIARDIGGGPYVKFIQTDASINRGNSGGPLFNIEGKVIGINSAIISQSGGSIGLGFAIPSNIAKKIVYQLIEFGRTKRGWLGVQIQNVTDEIAESLDLENNQGAFVASIQEGSPAEEFGIEAGDIILEFNGNTIETYRDLPKLVAETDVDTVVIVKVWRKNEILDISIKLGELEETYYFTNKNEDPNETKKEVSLEIADLGISIRDINQEDFNNFGLENEITGVIVTKKSIDDISIQENDIIVEVNREQIIDTSQFKDKISEIKLTGRTSILLRVIRENKNIWVTLKYL